MVQVALYALRSQKWILPTVQLPGHDGAASA